MYHYRTFSRSECRSQFNAPALKFKITNLNKCAHITRLLQLVNLVTQSKHKHMEGVNTYFIVVQGFQLKCQFQVQQLIMSEAITTGNKNPAQVQN